MVSDLLPADRGLLSTGPASPSWSRSLCWTPGRSGESAGSSEGTDAAQTPGAQTASFPVPVPAPQGSSDRGHHGSRTMHTRAHAWCTHVHTRATQQARGTDSMAENRQFTHNDWSQIINNKVALQFYLQRKVKIRALNKTWTWRLRWSRSTRMKSVETRPGKENTRAAGLPWGHSLSLSPPAHRVRVCRGLRGRVRRVWGRQNEDVP